MADHRSARRRAASERATGIGGVAGPDNARDRLLAAAWETLREGGPHAATTRTVARRAGVNEVTVFRLFESKDGLLAAALRQRTAPLRDAVLTPTADVSVDLLRLAQNYSDLAHRDVGVLLRLLPVLSRDSPLLAAVRPVLHGLVEGARHLMQHHQKTGALDARHRPDHLVWEFIGPLFAAASLSPILDLDPRVPLPEHVRLFLAGHPAAQTRDAHTTTGPEPDDGS